MGLSQAPVTLESGHQLHKFRIIPQLRVHHFNVLSIPLREQVSQASETFLNLVAKTANGCTLILTDLPANVISCNENRNVQVVAPLTDVVRHRVYL